MHEGRQPGPFSIANLRHVLNYRIWSPNTQSFMAAFFYFAVSILLTLLNKSVFALYAFKATKVLAIAQMLCAIVFLHGFHRAGLIKLPTLQWQTASVCAPLALSYLAMMVCGFDAMRGTNLVMFDTLRRTTIVFAIVVEKIFMDTLPSHAVMGTSLVCLFGTLIAGASDLTFDAWGYFMAGLTNLSTSCYIVLIRWVKKHTARDPLDSFGMLYYNVLLSLPFTIIYVVLFSDDVAIVSAFEHWSSLGFLLVFGMSSILGFVINYSVFLNTLVNSALTQVITGQAKSIGVLTLGAVLFNDVLFTATNLLGVIVSVVGGALYAWVKYQEAEAERAEKAARAAQARALEEVAVVSSTQMTATEPADSERAPLIAASNAGANASAAAAPAAAGEPNKLS